jgi:hypothetical protein
MRFRKKPVIIEAVQLRWDTWDEMCEHAGVGRLVDGAPEGCYLGVDGNPTDVPLYAFDDPTDHLGDGPRIGLKIPTLEGLMIGRQGDWIIKGVRGELYPCKPDIFERTYEPVDALGKKEVQ